jgi:serine/threonine-protein kinase 24/25/MST4
VCKGIHNHTKKVTAMKFMDLEEVKDETNDIQQVITMLSQCDNPYLTRYFSSYLKSAELWLITEDLSGGLHWTCQNQAPWRRPISPPTCGGL